MQQELIRLRNRNPEQPTYTPPAVQIAELQQLRQSLTENTLLFSGHLTVYTFGYNQSQHTPISPISPASPTSPIKPCYTGSNLLATNTDNRKLITDN